MPDVPQLKLKPPELEPGCGVKLPSLVIDGVSLPSLGLREGMWSVEPLRDGVGDSNGDVAAKAEVGEGFVMGRKSEGMKSRDVLPMVVATASVEVMAKPLSANVLEDGEVMVASSGTVKKWNHKQKREGVINSSSASS